MTRPAYVPVESTLAGWDSYVNDGFEIAFGAPLPIAESSTINDAAELETAFPAAQHDRCVFWVNDTTYGYTLYRSNGTAWERYDPRVKGRRNITATDGQDFDDQIVTCSGTLPFSFNLLPASLWKGRTVIVKTLVSGTLTIDADSSDTIDGAGNVTITTQYGALQLYSDGTDIFIVGKF